MSYSVRVVKLLREMHTAGLVHCDVKPDNVMITFDEEITLIDFGLSHRYLDEKGNHVPYRLLEKFKGTW